MAGLEPTETTRYLCAAAYIDRRFADEAISGVLEEEHRAVAPSYGVDLVPVIRHCLAARRRRLVRDAILVGLLVAGWPLLTMSGSVVSAALRVLVAAWAVVFIDACLSRYEILAGQMLRGKFDPDAAPPPTSTRQAKLIQELRHNEYGNVILY